MDGNGTRLFQSVSTRYQLLSRIRRESAASYKAEIQMTMNKYDFKRAAMLVIITVFSPAFYAEGSGPPNIVSIVVDDLGWGDLGCYGNPEIKTPNMDRLAAEGTLFTQFYVNGTTCSPTRTGLMTGHFPAYHHYHFNPKGAETYPDGSPTKFLDPKLTLLPKLLQSGGYATALFGKWHLGASGNPQSPPPSAYGLDEYCTHGYEPHRPRYHDRNKGETRELWSKLTGMIIDDSIDFAKRHKDKPFFLNVWTYLPHAILNPTDEQLAPFEYLNPPSKYTREKTGTSPFAIYYASVYNLDQEIGRLMKALDDLGLSENTLVMLTSDNGPEDIHLPSASNAAIGTAGPFRGRKRSIHEGGIRTPLIVRWPGKVRQQRVDTESVITGVDYLPTFCALTGVKLPDGYRTDGEDVSGMLFGTPRPRTKPLFWRCAEADGPLMGNVVNKSPMLGMREGDWKFLINPDGSDAQLYRIIEDPAEMNNLADDTPQVALEMKTKLLAWHNGLPKNDPRFERNKPGRYDWRWPQQAEGYGNMKSNLVFQDDFEQGTAANWVPVTGTWRVDAGAYVQSDKDRSGPKYSGPADLELKDFILKFSVQLVDGDVVRILLRENGKTNYTLDLGRVQGWSAIKSFSSESRGRIIAPVYAALGDKKEHQVKIQAIGDEIKIWVDGSQCAYVKNAEIKSGSFKLGTWLAEAKFNDVEIYELITGN